MSKVDTADFCKINDAVVALTRETIEAGKDRAVFESTPLFRSLKFSRMTSNRFPAALMDVPSGSEFCKMFGDWVIAEVGDDLYVLIKLGEHKNPWYESEEFYKKNYRAELPPKTKKPNVVKIDLPEGMTAADVNKILTEARKTQNGGQ